MSKEGAAEIQELLKIHKSTNALPIKLMPLFSCIKIIPTKKLKTLCFWMKELFEDIEIFINPKALKAS